MLWVVISLLELAAGCPSPDEHRNERNLKKEMTWFHIGNVPKCVTILFESTRLLCLRVHHEHGGERQGRMAKRVLANQMAYSGNWFFVTNRIGLEKQNGRRKDEDCPRRHRVLRGFHLDGFDEQVPSLWRQQHSRSFLRYMVISNLLHSYVQVPVRFNLHHLLASGRVGQEF